jgi:chromosome segregation ATPase
MADAQANASPVSDTETGAQAKQPVTDAAKRVLEARQKYLDFEDDPKFKSTFRQAVQDGLALIRRVLTKLEKKKIEKGSQTLSPSFESFNTTLASLKAILEQISNAEEDERFQCYKNYIDNSDRNNLVEALVSKMMDDVNHIVNDYGAGEDLRKELAELQTAIKELKNMPPSVPTNQPEAGKYFHNSGSGSQYNATDQARQFNGTTMNGGVTFN